MSQIFSLADVECMLCSDILRFPPLGIGIKEDIVIHLGCNSEVGLTFDDGSATLKNCTILVNNKQSGVAVKVSFFLKSYFKFLLSLKEVLVYRVTLRWKTASCEGHQRV